MLGVGRGWVSRALLVLFHPPGAGDQNGAGISSLNQLLIECLLSVFFPSQQGGAPPPASPSGTAPTATVSCSVPKLGDMDVHKRTSLLMPPAGQGDSHTQRVKSKDQAGRTATTTDHPMAIPLQCLSSIPGEWDPLEFHRVGKGAEVARPPVPCHWLHCSLFLARRSQRGDGKR